MYNDELQLIPENIINDYLNKDFTSLVVCENCGLKEGELHLYKGRCFLV